jgi:hypothetical protein
VPFCYVRLLSLSLRKKERKKERRREEGRFFL